MEVLPAVVGLGALAAAVGLAAPDARADPDDLDDLIDRPLVLAPGAVELRVTASINVQVRSIAMPISLAPDVWWGVMPRWTIGIVHSDASLDQIATSGSFCVRETALSTCDGLYHGGGLDVRYAALDGNVAIAPRLRVLVRDIDPFKPAITLGATARWVHGAFAIAGDPYLRLPLANHALGNASAIMLPVWLDWQPAAGWLLALRTGYDADLVVLRDGSHVAFGVDLTTRVAEHVDVAASAGWAALYGPQRDARHATLMIAVSWRDQPTVPSSRPPSPTARR